VDGATVAIGGSPASGVSRVAATELLATTPALAPGTLNDVAVTNPDATTATLPGAFVSDFLDVPEGDIFHDDVVTIFLRGITGGCGGGLYCRDAPVSRAQMAAFLLKAEHGASHVPPACTGIFSDVVCPGPFSDWIEELSIDGITAGCGPDLYCPDNPVTRQQMAVFLLKTANGATYVPPPCIGIFGDVPCSSPFAPWVEELYKSGVSGGCSSGLILYCPQSPTRRGQMAVFLVKTFGLF